MKDFSGTNVFLIVLVSTRSYTSEFSSFDLILQFVKNILS